MEQTAYWDLVQQHLPYLKERARKMAYHVLSTSRTGSVYSADDLLHEVLVKIGRNPAQLRYNLEEGQDGFLKLCNVALRTVAYGLISRSDSRKCRTLEPQAGEQSGGPDGEPLSQSTRLQEALRDRQLTPVELLEKQDEEHNLREALHALGEQYPQTALVLLYSLEVTDGSSQGANHRQKAEEIGISHTSYRQHVFQGIRRLRRRLG